LPSLQNRPRVGQIVRVASGNFLEMYDFSIFGYYATFIGQTFFPGGESSDQDFIRLLSAFLTFGMGFVMRPLGALFLGAYIDRRGRRAGLILTLGLMSIGTLVIAVLPGYASIGLAAPILILLGRLIQGFSAGAELGGVSVYLSEIATPGKKGFYVSWQSASQQLAVVFAALIGIVLNERLSTQSMQSWGWRVPLWIGCAIIPVVFVLRRSLEETVAFRARRHYLTSRQIFQSLSKNWRVVLLGMMMVLMTTVTFHLIAIYLPTFGRNVLHFSQTEAFIVTLCVGISNLFWLPVSGAISDRLGRRPLLLGCTVAAILTAYPVLSWVISSPSVGHLMVAELWFSMIFGCYNGALVVYLTEIMPEDVRTSGFSMAYSLATIVGGMTPAIVTVLIHQSANGAMPGAWMAFVAAVSLGALGMSARTSAGSALTAPMYGDNVPVEK
jgi:MFS family permease